MIKIPATKEGLPAITQAIRKGININVTLIFSIERYQEVMDAYLLGLEQRIEQGEPIDAIASVASFFVSRIDTEVDDRLGDLVDRGKVLLVRARELQGNLAIASAKLAYESHKNIFSSERFNHIKDAGGKIQRPLWASTSTKNPLYPDTMYVSSLIGPHSVNTVPPKTLTAFKDHGVVALTLESGLDAAREALENLAAVGISLAEVTQALEDQGVRLFADAFTALLESIEKRRQAAIE
jgi:transaldolase